MTPLVFTFKGELQVPEQKQGALISGVQTPDIQGQ